MANTDPRLDSTRQWSKPKLYLTIGGIILVMLVASSVFWLPVIVGPDETPAVEQTTTNP